MIGRISLTLIFLHLIVCFLFFVKNFYEDRDYITFLKSLSWINLVGVFTLIGFFTYKIYYKSEEIEAMGNGEIILMLFLMLVYSVYIFVDLNFKEKKISN